MTNSAPAGRTPILSGLLSSPLDDLDNVRLMGTRCGRCHEVSLGSKEVCPNCGAAEIDHVPLSRSGFLWSYTVARHKPPGDFRCNGPFEPFGLGLVELPEGLRVYAPVECPIESLEIGMPLRFSPIVWQDDSGEVVSFRFTASGAPENDE